MPGLIGTIGAVLALAASVFGGAAALPPVPPKEPARLAQDLNQAEQIIDARGSTAKDVASAAQFEQLATAELARAPAPASRQTISLLDRSAADAMRANLDAAAALGRLQTPRHSLPHWRIIQPPPPSLLLGYFKTAETRSGVRWQYLAAIELIETAFGRVDGLSVVGAEGPMQFMPATWAAYGRGNVHNPRDAILAAARYLAANGAPRDMASAIYHYNPSEDYVQAVEDYAAQMRADARAYYGYYDWQVIYEYNRHRVILPTGFPKARPIPLPT